MKQLKQGMVIGYSEFDTPEDAYTFGLNIQRSSQYIEGELTDEGSNSLVISLPENYQLLGTVNLLNDELILFSLYGNDFEIGKQVKDQYITLVNTSCFNYSMKNPIKGEFRVVNGCKNIVYWYNGVEPDRFIRLDDLDYHKDNSGDWECNSFLLKPEYIIPQITMSGLVESGGNLPVSSYSISARYLDDMYNPTDWFGETQPYPITNLGSFNSPDTIEGVELNEPTSNGLLYKVYGLDKRYKYLEICVNKYTNPYSVQSYSYNTYEIINNSLEVSITSINNLIDLKYKDTIVPTAKYENSKSMIQYDNRLIRANITEKVYDWGEFQKRANFITTNYNITEVDIETNNTITINPFSGLSEINYINGAKSPFAYESKSLMRDEVYALGIIWIMKDGSESPVFHIPGRLKNYSSVFPVTLLPDNYEPNLHNRPLPINGWDSTLYNILGNEDAQIYEGITNEVERWQPWNTAIQDGYQSICGYYECRDLDNNPILYPNIKGCDGLPIYPSIQDIVTLEYTMSPIRHHRMPDTTLEPIVSQDGTKLRYLYLKFDNINIPTGYEDIVQAYRMVISDRIDDKTVIDKGILNTVYRKEFQYQTADTVTDINSDVRIFYDQGLQFSHDNQSPKAHNFQTSIEFTTFVGGDRTMLCVPACSETLTYQKELCEHIGNRATKASNGRVSYHSPLSKLLKTEIKGTHIKYEREIITDMDFISGEVGFLGAISNNRFMVVNNRKKYKNRETKNILTTNVYQQYYKSYIPYNELTNRNITKSMWVDADATYNDTQFNTWNNKTQQEALIIGFSKHEEGSYIDDAYCTYGTETGITFTHPFNLIVGDNFWMTPGIYTLACNWLEGDSQYTKGGIMSHNYVSIKQLKTDCYYQLDKIKYINVTQYNTSSQNNDYFLTGGDIFLTRMAFRKTYYGYVPHADKVSTKETIGFNSIGEANSVNLYNQDSVAINGVYGDVNSVFESLIIDTWYESEVNIEFRGHDEATWNNSFFTDGNTPSPTGDLAANANIKTQLFFPKYYGEYGKELLLLELNANSISRLTDNGEWKFYQLFPNYYKLNEVYNIKYPNNRYLPLNRQYDWCDECTGKYKNRLIWSQKSYEEDINDTYRKYLVNNYIDVIASSGQVTELLEQQQKIYVNTEHSMYVLPQTNETVQLTDGTANIGTGEFFSIPAIRLSNAAYSYAGNQGRFNKLITEYGTLFINQEQKKVYLFNDNLEDIGQSIQIYLNNNLYSWFGEQYKDTMLVDYEYLDNHTYEAGLGLITTFDYTNKRFIIHKKDFAPLYPLNDENRDTLYFNEVTQSWYWTDHDLEDVPAPFTNQEFWENKSFTLSYDITSKTWLSFHSYQPNIFYYNNETFYSSYDLYNLYKHTNKATKRTFYEVTYPSMIEYISYANPKAVKADNINYLLKVQQNNINLTDTSFHSAIMYNSYQSSGEFDIIFRSNPYDTRLWSNTEKYVSVLDNIHRVTGIKDMVYLNSAPINTSDWTDIQSYYDGNGQGYIDKIPNSTVLDFTKNLYNTSQFKDQYQRVRLIFDDNSGKSFRLQLLDNNTTQSFR